MGREAEPSFINAQHQADYRALRDEFRQLPSRQLPVGSEVTTVQEDLDGEPCEVLGRVLHIEDNLSLIRHAKRHLCDTWVEEHDISAGHLLPERPMGLVTTARNVLSEYAGFLELVTGAPNSLGASLAGLALDALCDLFRPLVCLDLSARYLVALNGLIADALGDLRALRVCRQGATAHSRCRACVGAVLRPCLVMARQAHRAWAFALDLGAQLHPPSGPAGPAAAHTHVLRMVEQSTAVVGTCLPLVAQASHTLLHAAASTLRTAERRTLTALALCTLDSMREHAEDVAAGTAMLTAALGPSASFSASPLAAAAHRAASAVEAVDAICAAARTTFQAEEASVVLHAFRPAFASTAWHGFLPHSTEARPTPGTHAVLVQACHLVSDVRRVHARPANGASLGCALAGAVAEVASTAAGAIASVRPSRAWAQQHRLDALALAVGLSLVLEAVFEVGEAPPDTEEGAEGGSEAGKKPEEYPGDAALARGAEALETLRDLLIAVAVLHAPPPVVCGALDPHGELSSGSETSGVPSAAVAATASAADSGVRSLPLLPTSAAAAAAAAPRTAKLPPLPLPRGAGPAVPPETDAAPRGAGGDPGRREAQGSVEALAAATLPSASLQWCTSLAAQLASAPEAEAVLFGPAPLALRSTAEWRLAVALDDGVPDPRGEAGPQPQRAEALTRIHRLSRHLYGAVEEAQGVIPWAAMTQEARRVLPDAVVRQLVAARPEVGDWEAPPLEEEAEPYVAHLRALARTLPYSA